MRAILTYHSVDRSGSVVSVSPEELARHVAFLARAGRRVTSLERLVQAGGSGEAALALTFDDGFASFASEAWPRLAEAGIPATLFVVAGRVGGRNDWEPEGGAVPGLPLLSWDELGRLHEEGCELGLHGRTHRRLVGLSPAEIEDELAGAAELVRARTGAAARSFAYPYGELDAASLAGVRRTFRRACTTELRLLSTDDDAWLLPRLDAFYLRAPGRLEAFGTPAFRRFVAWRGLARRARRRVSSLLASRTPRRAEAAR